MTTRAQRAVARRFGLGDEDIRRLANSGELVTVTNPDYDLVSMRALSDMAKAKNKRRMQRLEALRLAGN